MLRLRTTILISILVWVGWLLLGYVWVLPTEHTGFFTLIFKTLFIAGISGLIYSFLFLLPLLVGLFSPVRKSVRWLCLVIAVLVLLWGIVSISANYQGERQRFQYPDEISQVKVVLMSSYHVSVYPALHFFRLVLCSLGFASCSFE